MSDFLQFPAKLPDAGGLPTVEPLSSLSYQTDFPVSQVLPTFEGESIKVRRHPHPANPAREFTYWHMVTEGERGEEDERTRTPDLARMVRMPWAKPLLVNHKHATVKRWWNVREGLRHYCLWHQKTNYVLIIKARSDGMFLVTTYCPVPIRVLEFNMEWAKAKKAGRTF